MQAGSEKIHVVFPDKSRYNRLCKLEVVKRMEQTAAEHHIAVQRDIMLSGGTDGGAIHVTRCGVRTGGISIPCRYVHSPVEKVSIQDLEACVRLAAAFAQADLPR